MYGGCILLCVPDRVHVVLGHAFLCVRGRKDGIQGLRRRPSPLATAAVASLKAAMANRRLIGARGADRAEEVGGAEGGEGALFLPSCQVQPKQPHALPGFLVRLLCCLVLLPVPVRQVPGKRSKSVVGGGGARVQRLGGGGRGVDLGPDPLEESPTPAGLSAGCLGRRV